MPVLHQLYFHRSKISEPFLLQLHFCSDSDQIESGKKHRKLQLNPWKFCSKSCACLFRLFLFADVRSWLLTCIVAYIIIIMQPGVKVQHSYACFGVLSESWILTRKNLQRRLCSYSVWNKPDVYQNKSQMALHWSEWNLKHRFVYPIAFELIMSWLFVVVWYGL